MLKKDESIEHIEEWSNKHEAVVQEKDAPIEELQSRIKELKERENKERIGEEDQNEEACLQWRFDKETMLKPWRLNFGKTKILKETVANN